MHCIVLVSFCWVINYPKPSGFTQLMWPQVVWAGGLGWHSGAVLLIPAGPSVCLLPAACPWGGDAAVVRSLSHPGSCLSPETSPWPAGWVTFSWRHVSQRQQAPALTHKHLCAPVPVAFACCLTGKASVMAHLSHGEKSFLRAWDGRGHFSSHLTAYYSPPQLQIIRSFHIKHPQWLPGCPESS